MVCVQCGTRRPMALTRPEMLTITVHLETQTGFRALLASFPGLPQLQFLVARSIHQKLEPGNAWERG